ncbi:MAG TPA: hypothetical protein VET89_01495, partial [Stellaceae bacterium]|nr:hypothetical protein [Stellaceae bacterium]
LVCIPLVGDQPENAARVVARHAGIRIGKESSPAQIRVAIRRLLTEPQFGQNAAVMASMLKSEGVAEQKAAEEIVGILDAARRDPAPEASAAS